MARATETYSLIRPELPSIDDYQCKPCSMIREGAVCRPEPPSAQWKPSDEAFVKNGLAVRLELIGLTHTGCSQVISTLYTG